MEQTTNLTGPWGWFWVAVFLALFMGIGLYGMRKVKTGEDFAVARSAYGPFMLAFAFAATIASGSTFMGLPGLAYSKGFAAIWYPAIYPIGIYLGVILTIKFVKRIGDRFKSNSLPELMGQRYDSDFLRIAFALLSLLLIYYITAQFVAAATIFEIILGLNYQTAILMTAGVVAGYIALGGTHADIMTDGVQGAMMVLIALVIAALFLLGYGMPGTGPSVINDALVSQDATLGWDNYFAPGDPIFGSLLLVFLMFVAHLPFAMNPHIGKLAFSLKDSSQLRVFLILVIPLGSILGFTVLGGLHARALLGPEIRPDAAIPALFTHLFPPFLAGLLGVAVLSAIMSTADGLFIAIAVIFSNDLYKRTLAPRFHAHKSPEQIDRNALWISRIATVLVGVSAVILAWDPPKFLAVLLWIGVGGIVSGAAGPLMIGLLWRRATRAGAIASFLTGVGLYATLWLGIGWKNPFGAAGVCVMVASAVMVVVSLMTRPMDERYLARIFGRDSAEGGAAPAAK
jgi:SSS family transporter